MGDYDMIKKNKKTDGDNKNKNTDNPSEKTPQKESFWKSFSKILCSLAMFNAINKHY